MDSSLLSEGTLVMNNSVERSPSEANSSAFSCDSPCALQNLKVHHHVHKTLSLAQT
jgi:hypothetical protein